MMIVKVEKTSNDGVATLSTRDRTISYPVVLDETLRNKMCRRQRAYFETLATDDGDLALFKRLPDQRW